MDHFSIFPSLLITKTTGAKKVAKLLASYIRIHGIPQSIKTDHGSGFKNDLVQQFCSSKGIKHIVSPVGDHRGRGSVERSMQTINRKLGTAKLDPNFGNFKETTQQIVENIRKGNNSVLKKSPFELHFGRKPNTEWSQAYHNIVKTDTSAQGLERNLLTPDQIASQDYSRDRAKVVPRGSASPTITPRFQPMFSLDGNVADNEPYKALAELAPAANKWSQCKRNLPADSSKRVLKELSSRHSDLAHSLKTDITRNFLRFSVHGPSSTPPEAPDSSRKLPAQQPRRPTKTINMDKLLLSEPVMLEQRPENPSLSDPIVVDFKADSSSEGSSGSNHLQVVRESTPVEKRIKLHKDSPPTTFAHPTNSSPQPPNIDRTTSSPPTASAAQITGSGSADSRIEFLTPHRVSSEGLIQPSHDAL